MASSLNNNLIIAQSYYNAMMEKNFTKMASCIHENVYFISPFITMSGKQNVVDAAKKFAETLENFQIRTSFLADDQVILVYNMVLSKPIGELRACAFMKFTDEQISYIELFFDTKIFIL